jgi:hypothetical protein
VHWVARDLGKGLADRDQRGRYGRSVSSSDEAIDSVEYLVLVRTVRLAGLASQKEWERVACI